MTPGIDPPTWTPEEVERRLRQVYAYLLRLADREDRENDQDQEQAQQLVYATMPSGEEVRCLPMD